MRRVFAAVAFSCLGAGFGPPAWGQPAPETAADRPRRPASVKVLPAQKMQTILGWGKTTPWAGASEMLRDQAIDWAVHDFGINRLRFEGLCGNGLDRRSWEWLNDNDDPNRINWDGFNTAQLDQRVAAWLVPWKKAVQARGENFDLYVSPSFFRGGSSGDTPPWLTDPDEYAEWAEALLLRLRDTHGIEADWYSICNEAGNNNRFDPATVVRCAKALMPRLARSGFKTKLQYPESINAHTAWRYLDAVRRDEQMWPWIGVISYHWYGRDNQSAMVKLRDLARQRGLPTAQTEFMNLTIDHLYDDMVLGGVSYWEVYGLVGPDYQAALSHVSSTTLRGGPWYWRFRQVSHYVRPGAVRVGCESDDPSLRCLAFVADAKATVVLINTAQPLAPRQAAVTGLAPGDYAVSQTTGRSPVKELGVRRVDDDGRLTVEAPRDGVLTIYPHDGADRPPTVIEWRSKPDFLHAPQKSAELICAATDPEARPLRYRWSVVRQPAGAQATIAHPDAASTKVDGLASPGEYVFAVEVGDGANTVRREVLMKVFDGNQPPVPMDVHNRIPVWVRKGDGGTLLRAGAFDVERDRVSFAWTIRRQPAGAKATLETPDKPACQVRGMTVPGDYVFGLTIKDAKNTVTVEHTVPVHP